MNNVPMIEIASRIDTASYMDRSSRIDTAPKMDNVPMIDIVSRVDNVQKIETVSRIDMRKCPWDTLVNKNNRWSRLGIEY